MFLPFLPLLPIHILIQNLLCDFAQKSKSSKQLIISTFTITLITLLITFTNIATIFDLRKLPYEYILGMLIMLCIQIYKKIYLKKNKE